jgi:hypothetical protein
MRYCPVAFVAMESATKIIRPTKTSKRELFGTLPFRLGGALTCTPYYGKCRTKFPDKVLGVLNIDLANRASSSISLVSPQAAMPSKSIHLRQRSRATRAVDSTLRTHNRLLLQMEGNRIAVHRNAQVKRQNEGARLTKIESLSPAIHDCLPSFDLSTESLWRSS